MKNAILIRDVEIYDALVAIQARRGNPSLASLAREAIDSHFRSKLLSFSCAAEAIGEVSSLVIANGGGVIHVHTGKGECVVMARFPEGVQTAELEAELSK
jgi:hypothetical protein